MLNRKYRNVQVDGDLLISKSGRMAIRHPGGTMSYNTPEFEVLNTTRTVLANESGKTFLLNLAGGFVTTLPPVAFGLKFNFIVQTAPTSAYTIVTDASANVIVGLQMSAAAAGGDTGTTDDTISFVASQAVAGDKVELVSDGVKWYAYAVTKVLAGLTFTTAS
jgi:hypothetical protein